MGECLPVDIQVVIVIVVTSVVAGYIFMPFATLWWRLVDLAVSYIDKKYLRPMRERKQHDELMEWYNELPDDVRETMENVAQGLADAAMGRIID